MSLIMSNVINNLEKIDKEEFLEICDNLKIDTLYKTPIHGIYHSEKVLLFSYMLAKELKLDNKDLNLICDAAKYHDIGRTSDFEDIWHGKMSAEKINDVVNYDNKYELLLLKSIIEGHSRKDSEKDRNFEDYFWEYDDIFDQYKKRYDILYDILKDADALDIARLIGTTGSLDKDYLRLKQSENYIDFAENINDEYIKYFENHPELDSLNKGNGVCYHGFGLDYFKIESILKYGILSYREMKNLNISGTKNFPGGNCRNYISCVVDDLVISSEPYETSAYKNFTEKGINIKTKNIEWFEASKRDNLPMALYKGRPYKKANYSDERYVKDKIKPDNFDSIYIKKNIADLKVKDGFYIMPSLTYNIIAQRVCYFLAKTNNTASKELIVVLKQYKKLLDEFIEYEKNDKINKEYLSHLNENILYENMKLQPIIGKFISKYYSNILNKEENDVCVKDCLEYELKKCNYNNKADIKNDFLVYNINEEKSIFDIECKDIDYENNNSKIKQR